MTLGDFLKREAGSSAPWNCSTTAGDWCLLLGHPDFVARWRRITKAAECAYTARRGLVRLWDRGIRGALPVVKAPYLAGDIAVVEANGAEAGAIFTGQRWAIRKSRGFLFAAPDDVAVTKAWRP